MHKKIIRLLLCVFFGVHETSVQAYGAVPLIVYAVSKQLAHIEDWGFPSSSQNKDHHVREEQITFADVVGAQRAKDALLDIVNAIKYPEIYKKIGAKMPRGVLLEGSPGNGKTLLAKALAYEADMHFIAINGANFTDKWVGEGVQRVKELFDKARAQAPCIIFIDEIDALGTRAEEFGGGAQTETNRVISELLTQLDGMATDPTKSLVVIGATNNKARLDPALLRSGRFDRAVRIEDPTLEERKELLIFYGKKVTLSADINFDALAARTRGFSGADCANLVNQAALCAVRRKAVCIEQRDFIEALETCDIRKFL